MNVVDVWLIYQGINGTAETQADLYNFLAEEMIDNTYNRFMILSTEGRRRTIFDSDDATFDDEQPTVWSDQWCSHMWNCSTCDPQ